MQRVGVKCVDVHAVDDNIMAKIADPTFIGK
jgi:UDP-N-acetylglucosamine pyrophosphorylase